MASDSWIFISVAPDTWQSPKWRYWWVECHFWGGSTGLPPLFLGGEGTAMFFFFAFVFHLALGKLEGWRVREQEGKVIQNVDVLTFPVSVLVFQEYYFISKFKWKSDERWDCFCLCLFWYPTSLLANCWACLLVHSRRWTNGDWIPGFPWSKPLPWENWSAWSWTQVIQYCQFRCFGADWLSSCQSSRFEKCHVFFCWKGQRLHPGPWCYAEPSDAGERLTSLGWFQHPQGFGPRAACFILQARMLCSSSCGAFQVCLHTGWLYKLWCVQ